MAELRERLNKYPDISFIDNLEFSDFLDSMIEQYQNSYQKITGKKKIFSKAEPEYLTLLTCAMYLYQGYQCIDKGGKMGLLKYSVRDYLDHLGASRGIQRNCAQAAVTTIRFSLSKPRNEVISIPAGTRVKVENLFFATTEYAEFEKGSSEKDVLVVCMEAGEAGNGYFPGEITVLVDPIPYVESVVNITETSGGSSEETDDAFAERIYLSPSSYSTAGAEDAYKYHIMAFNQSISNCIIRSESPGEVDIYVILEDGKVPEEDFLEKLEEYLSDKKIRPLTEKVVVKAPSIAKYDIDVEYFIRNDDKEMAAAIHENVQKAMQRYIKWQGDVIGRDINPSRLYYELMSAGVKNIIVNKPEFKEVTEAAIAQAENVEIRYGGLRDE